MRHTKRALLLFGFGLVFGLTILAAELDSLERAAAAVIALSLLLLPVALVADGRLIVLRQFAARFRRPPPRAKAARGARRPKARAEARSSGRSPARNARSGSGRRRR